MAKARILMFPGQEGSRSNEAELAKQSVLNETLLLQDRLEQNPNDKEALVNLGAILWSGAGQPEAKALAVEYFKKALAVDPKYQLALYNLGLYYDELGDKKNAKSYYQRAINSDEKLSADAYNNLAKLQIDEQDYSAARITLEELKKNCSIDAGSLSNIDNVLGQIKERLKPKF